MLYMILQNKIYYLDAVYDFSKDTLKGKEIVLSIVINLMNYYRFKKVIEQIRYKNYFNNILIKIFNSKYISNKDKILIKNKYMELNNNNSFFFNNNI